MVFPDRIYWAHRIHPTGNLFPILPKIVGFVNKWSHIIFAYGIDGNIGCTLIEMSGIDLGDFIP